MIVLHSLKHLTIIKIDIEGFEYKTLQRYGSHNIMENKPYILMDFTNDCRYNFTILTEFYKSLGCKIYSIENGDFLHTSEIEKPITTNDLFLVHQESNRGSLVNRLIKNN